jgi:hypothetical protein
MTVCKACGGDIAFAYLERHICPTRIPSTRRSVTNIANWKLSDAPATNASE